MPGSECRPIYQSGGPSAYACVPSEDPAVAHVSYVRHWAHTVDPRGCRSGLGCRSGAMGRRRAHLAGYSAINSFRPGAPISDAGFAMSSTDRKLLANPFEKNQGKDARISGPYSWVFGPKTPYSPFFRERKR